MRCNPEHPQAGQNQNVGFRFWNGGREEECMGLPVDHAGGCDLTAIIDAVAITIDRETGNAGAGQQERVQVIHSPVGVQKGTL